jgi:hypothetical protein
VHGHLTTPAVGITRRRPYVEANGTLVRIRLSSLRKYSPPDSNVVVSLSLSRLYRCHRLIIESLRCGCVYGFVCERSIEEGGEARSLSTYLRLGSHLDHEWDARRPGVTEVAYARSSAPAAPAPWTTYAKPAPGPAVSSSLVQAHIISASRILPFLQGTHATAPYTTLKQLRYRAGYTDRA